MTSGSNDAQTRRIRLPALSATMEEATLLSWKVSVGDEVRQGQGIAEVSTDKVDMDLESPLSGTIVELLVEPGTTVPLGEVMATISTTDEDLLGGLELEGDDSEAEDVVGDDVVSDDVVGDDVVGDDRVGTGDGAPAPGPADRQAAAEVGSGIVPASPPARKMASRLGVDLADVTPTGARGQVTPTDVKRHHESLADPGATEEPEAAPPPSEETTPPVPPPPTPEPAPAPATDDPRRMAVRRATTEVMTASAAIPQFTLYRTLRLDTAARHKGGESWTTILVRGLAAALRQHPEFNSHWDDQRREPVPFPSHRVGLAIDRPGVGLVVAAVADPDLPAVEDADSAVRRLADRARTGRLQPEDLAQASITLSNLGGLGVDRFNALLFPPQASILSAGTIAMRPVATGDGALKASLTCEVGLTVDHRVADGADGARFLETFAAIVQGT